VKISFFVGTKKFLGKDILVGNKFVKFSGRQNENE
jgi:hypothetical protein